MARTGFGKNLVIASHNEGKVREIRELFEPYGLDVRSAAELDLPEPEETGATFVENAILKAEAAATGCGIVSLADDSGLVVPALDGAPGIYSARWAGPEKDFDHAMARIENELGPDGDRAAHFVCVLALAHPDGTCDTYEGKVHGTLVWPPRGDKGFGYDPMFRPENYDETFGEIDQTQKHDISHRAAAFRLFIEDQFKDG
ncbi:MAG: non-canonical purine NTP pyrophosphatase, RdgB/HAM1 family [Rhodospirillaceae bacterium]|nr:non-canonical purine NTP pyrophosphatase, RdgB/HAM1 family [Rhodospirillaceae bacterium]HAA91169.1 non-canonical purine NTP pyrophosphatase, RdgB/HAM1 family [Rhodospirillaceae bacterium]